MKPHVLAKLIGVSPMTLRRWARLYDAHLTPRATPEKGEARFYSERDQRVFLLVKALRDAGVKPDDIRARLEDEQAHDYANLPEIPDAWRGQPDETIPLALAGARASEMASIAALQTQVQHLTGRLEEATQRAERLEAELQAARAEHAATDAHRRDLELSLKDAQAEAREAAARLEAFRLAYSFGRERPVNIGVIIVAALGAGALVVLIALVVVALVM